ncbi:hypothetical protein LOD99_11836 [Oopsacas minuta]|uniref:Uncharacterized protein n=1 Tax=Oopsacas minuta TaxID=111878 RepID=A0AAV7JKP8_9METZ|nr:hypothetical protein LOD99_11836 [Oopsacas minuta]
MDMRTVLFNICDKDEYIPVLSFPTDNEIREKWFRAIPQPREDYEMNKRLRVGCELVIILLINTILNSYHILFLQGLYTSFPEEDIERTIQFFDGMKMIKTERKKVALKKCAVPNIFPNCPSYLTDPTVSCQRLFLDDKEERRIQEAYQRSLADFKLKLSLLFLLLIVLIQSCI